MYCRLPPVPVTCRRYRSSPRRPSRDSTRSLCSSGSSRPWRTFEVHRRYFSARAPEDARPGTRWRSWPTVREGRPRLCSEVIVGDDEVRVYLQAAPEPVAAVEHAPCGLLNEKVRGCISAMEAPQLVHEKLSEKSIDSLAELSLPPFLSTVSIWTSPSERL